MQVIDNLGKGQSKPRLGMRPAVPSVTAIVLSTAAAFFGVGALSFAVERWLEGARDSVFRSMGDQFIAALVAATCVFVLRNNSRKRRFLDRQRFELIGASTQQIRQALQLITDSARPGTQEQHVISYAVDHIEWVLQEVLPTVHQEPSEVRARMKDSPGSETFTT
jgi:hypothetical protein